MIAVGFDKYVRVINSATMNENILQNKHGQLLSIWVRRNGAVQSSNQYRGLKRSAGAYIKQILHGYSFGARKAGNLEKWSRLSFRFLDKKLLIKSSQATLVNDVDVLPKKAVIGDMVANSWNIESDMAPVRVEKNAYKFCGVSNLRLVTGLADAMPLRIHMCDQVLIDARISSSQPKTQYCSHAGIDGYIKRIEPILGVGEQAMPTTQYHA